MDELNCDQRVPVVEERVRIDKRMVETGVVRIKSTTHEHTERISADLLREEVQIERVAIGRELDELPQVRQEGDVLIVPVVEEKLVVAKRWVLTEELHIRKHHRTERQDVPVTLRSTSVTVQREPSERTSEGDQ